MFGGSWSLVISRTAFGVKTRTPSSPPPPESSLRGRAMSNRKLVSRNVESRVDHTQRPEQAALQKLVERLAGRDLDDPRQHVDAPAIFPHFAGLVRERQSSEAGDEISQGVVGAERSLPAIEGVDGIDP